MYTVHLAKEPFKFSCSHFTILSERSAERLHGHNYQMRVALTLNQLDPKLGMAFDFNAIKPKIRMICDELDERILLPEKSPYLKIEAAAPQLSVKFAHKTYSFPEEDCLRLPLTNVTSEELSRYLCQRLATALSSIPHWTSLEVNIEETRGQSVTYAHQR